MGVIINIFKLPELRRRVLFTVAMLAVYRFGIFVAIPGVDRAAMAKVVAGGAGGLLGYLNLFTGGAFAQASVFALGIMPYISASIIMQLMQVVIPRLEELRKDPLPAGVLAVVSVNITAEAFEKMIADGELIEHAVVYGEYKGIPKAQVREKLALNVDVILRLDVQGAATVRALVPGAVFIFIAADSEASLCRRLVSRKTETPEKLVVRVEMAREELCRMREFDYVVVNEEGRLDEAAGKLAAIIDAEKMRPGREPLEL